MSCPPLRQLHNSVHTTPEDANRRKCECGKETLEFPAFAQLDEDGVLIKGALAHGGVALACADGEVDAEEHEDEEGEDLEGESGDHDVVSGGGVFVGVGCGGGEAATCCLEEERSEIAGDELFIY